MVRSILASSRQTSRPTNESSDAMCSTAWTSCSVVLPARSSSTRKIVNVATAMKRITRDRRLTPEEAARYNQVREQVAGELPDLIARHHERTAALDQLDELL